MRIKPLKYLLLVFVIVISDSSFICAKISPSFDCTKATTEVEKLICSDDELAKLDLTALCYFYDKLDCNNIKDKVDDLTCSDSELLKLYKQIQKKYFVYCMTISSDIDRINFYKEQVKWHNTQNTADYMSFGAYFRRVFYLKEAYLSKLSDLEQLLNLQ